ncbi:hypothetical protein BEWA_007470 [Theileria equi strain WA]|uniref:Uncharacterized protein n=1 Tax=Theileria equi strain WA TaxID=1537102 RepID=L0B1F9_THEEQ|nr:hypothetical protein BEWA_007470 [Theileria equi strain WA]AFZ81338.1 hypothetical protein BEWA_007470 [Theileria equi strain WA]|eukprot:XP_004831004.1 hypothetical protein BEWA_007470 [Theileria equi strain WA]
MSNTIDYSHMDNSTYKENVYTPSEDTFFFVDILKEDIPRILALEPLFVLEVGSGSGYISTYLLKLFESHLSNGSNVPLALESEIVRTDHSEAIQHLPFLVAVDINNRANESTMDMFKLNSVSSYSDVVCIDLLGESTVNRFFDLVLFNPPYVPCEYGLSGSQNLIDCAWNGGINGAEVIVSFIESVGSYLSENGVVYLLVEKRNKIDTIIRIVEDNGFKANLIGTRKIIGETLSMIRFSRSDEYNANT